MPACFFQCAEYLLALDVAKVCRSSIVKMIYSATGVRCVADRHVRFFYTGDNLGRQLPNGDQIDVTEQHGAFQAVAKLADVAAPIVLADGVQCRGCDLGCGGTSDLVEQVFG